MKHFDSEALKILSVYINKGGQSSPSTIYLDDLRPQIPKLQNEVQNLTFMNPAADRGQMFLEYYESHAEYLNAKIQLINNYLEAFEHTIDSKKSAEIIQIIVNIIKSKPILDLEVITWLT